MARDLIPPASPAGRPPADGTPNLIELPPEPSRSAAEPAMGPPPGPSEFRNRFGFLLGALAGVFIAAALVLVVVLSTSSDNADDAGLAPNWSRWQPSVTSVEGGAAEIAKHVGAEYKHPNGQQLVLVTGERLPVNVALQPASGPITVFDGTGVVYQLNGLGPKGSIKGGTPSAKRLQLIHREALELTLYTFRYLPDVEMVVTLLPPPPPSAEQTAASAAGLSTTNENEQTAVFYRPGDLKPQLQVPLGQTLSAKAPNPDTIGGAEAKTVETLTQSNIFKWSADQQMLVLTR
jgi:hypothetical protein